MLSPSPTIVPTSASEGRSGTTGRGTCGAGSGDTAAPAAGGGRRLGEKIGRSRVAESVRKGTAQSGFPLGACGDAG